MFSKMLSAATLALVVTLSSATAKAEPLFLLPDVNFASTGDALFIVDNDTYSLTIQTSVGDSMVIDNGTGFSFISNGSINVSVDGGAGAIAMTIGTGDSTSFVTGTLLTDTVTGNILGGHDIFAVFTVTESNMADFAVGSLLGFDVLSYNCHDIGQGIEACKVKGDVAPVVPEPATLSLLVIGLGGLAARARRKLG
ncbi:MAG: PEP-CTERM sorting domain-containing protein [Planctomycetota bacterium]